MVETVSRLGFSLCFARNPYPAGEVQRSKFRIPPLAQKTLSSVPKFQVGLTNYSDTTLVNAIGFKLLDKPSPISTPPSPIRVEFLEIFIRFFTNSSGIDGAYHLHQTVKPQHFGSLIGTHNHKSLRTTGLYNVGAVAQFGSLSRWWGSCRRAYL